MSSLWDQLNRLSQTVPGEPTPATSAAPSRSTLPPNCSAPQSRPVSSREGRFAPESLVLGHLRAQLPVRNACDVLVRRIAAARRLPVEAVARELNEGECRDFAEGARLLADPRQRVRIARIRRDLGTRYYEHW